jgi:purine-nucleoside/S-methyl-5'-thioadenosine phosphorylase / adenosine deaminase
MICKAMNFRPELPSSWITPRWPVPKHVHAVCTTREGGGSSAPFNTFNLSDRVGDNPITVDNNRAHLIEWLSLPARPTWLRQVHGNTVVDVGKLNGDVEADAAMAKSSGAVCVVTTADCLPVLFCDREGSRVAAAHAGWRGLAAGVLEATVVALSRPADQLYAWLGPAIGPRNFEVGGEVRAVFVAMDPANLSAFRPSQNARWLANIYQLAINALRAQGVSQIFGGGYCTYSDPKRFYSYRRDKRTGRMASLIWMA